SSADAEIARDCGVDGVILSNHGGRQLDQAVSPLEVMPRVLEKAAGLTVMIDSGFRRGTDVIKALALGAHAVFLSRPFLFAAAFTGHGHWKTTTFVAALRCDGVTAPFVIDKAMTGEIFLAYGRQFLLPTLRKGDIVIMDNLSAHKVDGIAEAIESVEARVQYLPSYSPDLNPIEMLFAKLKALLRKAKTRSIDALWQCIGELLDTVSVEECLNYFKHNGYGAA